MAEDFLTEDGFTDDDLLELIRKRRENRQNLDLAPSGLQQIGALARGIGAGFQGRDPGDVYLNDIQRAQNLKLNQAKQAALADQVELTSLKDLALRRNQQNFQNQLLKEKQQHDLDMIPYKQRARMEELAILSGDKKALAEMQNRSAMERTQYQGQSAAERQAQLLEAQRQLKELELSSREKVAGMQAARAQKTAATGTNEFKEFPKDTQIRIEELTKLSTKKTKGIGELEAAINQLKDPKIDKDQKVIIGQMLLKKLNDPEFSDAVGAEEVKRLGSYLSLMDITRPGSQLGRDIPRFTLQVENKLNQIKASKEALDNEINGLFGRPQKAIKTPSVAAQAATQVKPSKEQIEAELRRRGLR